MTALFRIVRVFTIAGTLAPLVLWGCSNPAGPTGAGTSAYTITYDGNGATGGTVPSDSMKYQQGASVTVLGNTGELYSANDLFAGWNTAADGSGTSYSSGATFKMGTANVTLFAQWTPVSAQWASAVSSGSGETMFNATAMDSSGNLYAVGFISGTGSYSFGNNVTAAGASSNSNAVIVKYNAQGVAQWARTVSGSSIGLNNSTFSGVAVDSSGNVYAAGDQSGNVTYTYGSSASATGAYNGPEAVLVKYDSQGNAKWARTPGTAPSYSGFEDVAVDASSGDVYAAGDIQGAGSFSFGAKSVAGKYTGENAVMVKYDTNGTAQWARSVAAGPNASIFIGAAVDSSGNAYAAGKQTGSSQFTYGSQSITGNSPQNNVVLVKYDSSGTVKWASTATSTSSGSGWFNRVSTDSAGDLYAVGVQATRGTFDFGNNATSAGTSSGINMMIVKYNEQGVAQWARSADAKTSCTYSTFTGVSSDSAGNAYVAGWQEGPCTYGKGVSLTTPTAYDSAVLVTYDSHGNALGVYSSNAQPGKSMFGGVAVDAHGNAYAVGYQYGNTTYAYGTHSASGAAASANNAVAVMYGP